MHATTCRVASTRVAHKGGIDREKAMHVGKHTLIRKSRRGGRFDTWIVLLHRKCRTITEGAVAAYILVLYELHRRQSFHRLWVTHWTTLTVPNYSHRKVICWATLLGQRRDYNEKPKRRGKEKAWFLKEQRKKHHKGDNPETKKRQSYRLDPWKGLLLKLKRGEP